MKKVNIIWLVGIAFGLTALFTWVFMNNLASSVGKFSTFAQAKKTGEDVDISGVWVDRENVESGDNSFEFYLEDSTKNKSRVRYFDPKPNNFESAEKIQIHGSFKGEIFLADKIYMKCPSKYGDQTFDAKDAAKAPEGMIK